MCNPLSFCLATKSNTKLDQAVWVEGEKLQSVLDGRDRGTDVLELKVQLDLIGKAVRAVVPQQMWAEIIAKLEELEQEQHAESLDVGTDSFDDADADDPYDPTEFIDEDDEF